MPWNNINFTHYYVKVKSTWLIRKWVIQNLFIFLARWHTPICNCLLKNVHTRKINHIVIFSIFSYCFFKIPCYTTGNLFMRSVRSWSRRTMSWVELPTRYWWKHHFVQINILWLLLESTNLSFCYFQNKSISSNQKESIFFDISPCTSQSKRSKTINCNSASRLRVFLDLARKIYKSHIYWINSSSLSPSGESWCEEKSAIKRAVKDV